MNFSNAVLEAMAVSPEQYPEANLPEIALAGRSNVGKSTLINRVLQRKKLAYTSSSPGKTRTVNFYTVGAQFRLVDLPGYGFARASKQAQAAWAKSIDTYLHTRENLCDVFLLVDLRHPPTALDRQMYAWITQAGFPGHVICTKADKVPRTRQARHKKEIECALGAAQDLLFSYSGLDRQGIDAVQALIGKIIGERSAS